MRLKDVCYQNLIKEIPTVKDTIPFLSVSSKLDKNSDVISCSVASPAPDGQKSHKYLKSYGDSIQSRIEFIDDRVEEGNIAVIN